MAASDKKWMQETELGCSYRGDDGSTLGCMFDKVIHITGDAKAGSGYECLNSASYKTWTYKFATSSTKELEMCIPLVPMTISEGLA